MNVLIMREYVKRCTENGVEPTWDGLKEFAEAEYNFKTKVIK